MGEGVVGGVVDARGVLVPVVGDFVVVVDVDPGERVRDGWPVGGSVDLTVLAAVGFAVGAVAAGDVDVDEVAKEEHEMRVETGKEFSEVSEAGDGEVVAKGQVGEVGD